MARSRARERELARRRYERRRLREHQQREKRRRRNTVVGASVGTLAVVAGLIALIVSLVNGGSGKSTAAASQPTSGATPSPSASAPASAAPTKCAAISPNPPAKGEPTVPPVSGKPPTSLVVKDVKTGTGAAAKQGSTVSVTYIGVACSTGKVFDASYLHGNTPFPVTPLGHAQVIEGWNQGLIGIRAGGVRELVIPPALGYGAGGQGDIAPNETLIFLVTAKTVKA